MNHLLLTKIIPKKRLWADWTVLPGGFQVTMDAGASVFVRDNDLALVDPKLPFVMRYLKANTNPTFGVSASLGYVHTLWTAPLCVRSSTRKLVAIVSVRSILTDRLALIIEGCSLPYTHEHIIGVEDTVKLPAGGISNQARISKKWLNAHYPEWDNRLLLAQELGLNAEACFFHIFNLATTLQTVVVPNDMVAVESTLSA